MIYKCNVCNGEGRIDRTTYNGYKICPKCLGKGEINWIENIFGVVKIKSSIELINTKRLCLHIEKFIKKIMSCDDCFERKKEVIKIFMDDLTTKKVIYEFNITELLNDGISVKYREWNSIEYISIDIN